MDNTVVLQYNQQVSEMSRLSRKPSLQALSYALRHSDVWPDDFVWNYGRTDCCAMGLANRLWPSKIPTASLVEMQAAFNLSAISAFKIFFDSGCTRPTSWFTRSILLLNINPTTSAAQIADVIDHYLEQGELRFIMGL